MADKDVRRDLSHRIAFMPQGLGRNLYPTLSVYENIDFHARLFGLDGQERTRQIARLMEATRLAPFSGRAAGKLSGGMKQKLSLCCALVHSPDLLILDEPTTGVDPLSRRQFWALVDDLRREHAGMTVIVATAYIEEAQRFERLLAMDAGRLLENKPTAGETAGFGWFGHYAVRPRAQCAARDGSARADQAFRRFHCCGSCQLYHSKRRDFRLSRQQRLRQVHHHENADRFVGSDRRRRHAVGQADRRGRLGHENARRLYVAGVFAV